MKNGETKLSLEDYFLLYRHPRRAFDLCRPHLNQIIEMHGFYKCHHNSKRFLVESVCSLDLAPPTRSVLDRTIRPSPSAALTAEEAAADVEALGWHECPVRSLYTLTSEAETSYLCGCTAAAAAASTYSPPRRRRAPPAEFVVVRRPRSKRKRISINALGPDDFRSSSTTPLPACSPPPTPPPPESPPPHSPSMPRPPTPPPPSSPPPPF